MNITGSFATIYNSYDVTILTKQTGAFSVVLHGSSFNSGRLQYDPSATRNYDLTNFDAYKTWTGKKR